MEMRIWLAMILIISLAGCAAGGYTGQEPSPYEERPWYLYDGPPPQQNSPEVLGGLSNGHNSDRSQWFLPGQVGPEGWG